MTDGGLARILGCGKKAVSARRKSLGVAPFTRQKRMNWDEIDDSLGKSTDAALAERFNCSTRAIKNRRRQLGVSAYETHAQSGKRGKLGTIHSLRALRSA
jgi:MarR-like DNA-binding transcriptional regulator SgrR of sgrS sRNA